MNHLGEQVLVDGQSPATIRYLGAVDGDPGEWIGVEWWTQTGKHNGTFQGKVYFHTKKPVGGSFIGAERISRGHSFVDAIERQYIKSSREEYQQKQIDYSLFGKEYSDYRIELNSLLRIDLSCQWVNGFDEENDEIYDNLRQIKELNLRQNLLERWSQFWTIFSKYFAEIEIVNLSNSRMIVDVESTREYPRVKQLVLIDTDNDCAAFEKILRSFPNLCDLYLDWNSLTHLSSTLVDQCRHLRSLSLSDNPSLSAWNPSIALLGRLPSLEELFLNNCSIKTIEIDSSFARLSSLFLSDNQIDSFRSIDELSLLPSLRSLSLLRNPLHPSDPIDASTAKQLIVARLPNLTHFNRVFIQRDERRGAEIDYLQRHAKDYFQCSTNFDVEHRQYRKLIEKYGEPNRPADEKSEKKGLVIRANLFSIEFQLEGEKSLVKKIPSSMTISKLKNFVKKLYPTRLNDRSIDLYFVLDAEHRQILGDDYQDIQFYFDGHAKTSTIQIHLIS